MAGRFPAPVGVWRAGGTLRGWCVGGPPNHHRHPNKKSPFQRNPGPGGRIRHPDPTALSASTRACLQHSDSMPASGAQTIRQSRPSVRQKAATSDHQRPLVATWQPPAAAQPNRPPGHFGCMSQRMKDRTGFFFLCMMPISSAPTSTRNSTTMTASTVTHWAAWDSRMASKPNTSDRP